MMKISIALLKTLSIWYLIIPVYLFLFGWVKPWISIPVCVALVYAQFSVWSSLKRPFEAVINFKVWHFLLLLFLCFWWVSFSGVGGFGLVLHDHHKTYSIARDVMDQHLPVSYEVGGKRYFLASYIAYYLIAPLIGGLFSYKLATLSLYIYISLGIFLSIVWFTRLSGKNGILAFLFFILIGGLDIAGFLFQNGFSEGSSRLLSGQYTLLYWANSFDLGKYLLYHGNTNLLFWAAPHAISTWMVSGIFFYELLEEKSLKSSPIYLFTAVFWSPFVLVGLFPYFLFQLFKEGIKPYLRPANFLLIPAFVLLVWFVNSVGVSDLKKGLAFLPFTGFKPLVKDLLSIGWFVFFEVLVWACIVWWFIGKSLMGQWKKVFFLMTLILCLIPLYRLGKYNDWVQRVSLPSLFLLWVFVLKSFSTRLQVWKKLLFLVLLMLGSLDSLAWLYQSIRFNGITFNHHPLPYDEVRTMPQASLENDWPLEQVLAPEDASFFRYVAKKKPLTKTK